MGRGRTSGFKKRRRKILEVQGFVCFYCTSRLDYNGVTADHVAPQSLGGHHGDENIVAACKSCNNDRGTMPVTRVLKIMNPLATLPDGDKWKRTREMLRLWTASQLKTQRRKYDKEMRVQCARSSCSLSMGLFCNATSQASES